MIKLLYLDIDGVLNNDSSFKDLIRVANTSAAIMDKPLIDNLKKFLDACPDVKIILSSTWRHSALKEAYAILTSHEIRLHGICDPSIQDKEEAINEHLNRYYGIEKRFMVLDDILMNFGSNMLTVPSTTGLQEKHISMLISHFSDPWQIA